MIKRILVGLGGTPFTTVSTQCATKLAALHQAQTTGVTVVDIAKLGKMGPVPVGGGYYAQKMRERKEQVTKEGIEQAIEAFKSSCSSQQVVCRRIEYEQKVDRICSLLGVSSTDLDILAGQNLTLPAPRVNHSAVVADIDRNLESTGLALVGNYFMGLAIEDCLARAASEYQRLNP